MLLAFLSNVLSELYTFSTLASAKKRFGGGVFVWASGSEKRNRKGCLLARVSEAPFETHFVCESQEGFFLETRQKFFLKRTKYT